MYYAEDIARCKMHSLRCKIMGYITALLCCIAALGMSAMAIAYINEAYAFPTWIWLIGVIVSYYIHGYHKKFDFYAQLYEDLEQLRESAMEDPTSFRTFLQLAQLREKVEKLNA